MIKIRAILLDACAVKDTNLLSKKMKFSDDEDEDEHEPFSS
jgi:hypothetical protein